MNNNYKKLTQLAKHEGELSKKYRKEMAEMPHKIKGNFIAFFGRQFSTSYKWNRCLKPYWGGFYIKFKDLELMVDPGINILERSQKIGVNLARTNAVFISHSHIDHKNDANVVIEMASYRENTSIKLMMSQKTLVDKAVSDYHISQVTNKSNENLVILDNQSEIDLGAGLLLSPIPVIHSVEGSYGFILNLDGLKIGYTADTGFYDTYKTLSGEYPISNAMVSKEIEAPGIFSDRLKKIFSGVDILVFDLISVEFRKYSAHNLYHATVPDAVELLRDSNVKLTIFDHFNPFGCLGPSYPKKVNSYIKKSAQTNTRLVGINGLVIELDKYYAGK